MQQQPLLLDSTASRDAPFARCVVTATPSVGWLRGPYSRAPHPTRRGHVLKNSAIRHQSSFLAKPSDGKSLSNRFPALTMSKEEQARLRRTGAPGRGRGSQGVETRDLSRNPHHPSLPLGTSGTSNDAPPRHARSNEKGKGHGKQREVHAGPASCVHRRRS